MTTLLDFQHLFQSLPNPYMVVDRELRYVAANDAYLRVTASRLEDLLGKSVLELFPNDPSDPNNPPLQQLRRSFEKVLSTGRADTLALIPYRVFRDVGSSSLSEERFWSATHTPLLDPDGRVAFIVQHTVDVTDLERLKSAAAADGWPASEAVGAGVLSRARSVQSQNVLLDEQRRELLGLFDQAPAFIAFLRSKDHVFELANRAYLDIVGRDDLLGRRVADALPEVVGQGFIGLLDEVFRSGRPFVGSGVQVVLNGATKVVDFIYQPVRDATGATIGILVQGMDVTARHEAEKTSNEARRAAEAFAAEMAAQSTKVREALEAATVRIRELELAAAR